MQGLLAMAARLALVTAAMAGLAACSSGSGSDGPLARPSFSSSSSSSASSSSSSTSSSSSSSAASSSSTSGSSSNSSSSSSGAATALPAPTWQPDVFEAPSVFANICQNPTTRRDPITEATVVERAGTEMHEKMWLRSIANLYYFWYDQLDAENDVNPDLYTLPDYYFEKIRVPADRFSYYYTQESYEELQAGVSTDIGVDLVDTTINGRFGFLIYFVEPGSINADRLTRGDLITAIDGVTITENNFQASYLSIVSHSAGDSFNLTLVPAGSDTSETVTVSVAESTRRSVPISKVLETATGPVGYLLFNLNNDNAEAELYQAINNFKSRNIRDLVVDLRYNGGGYLYVAAQLAYMIAGPDATRDAIFYDQAYNDRFPDTHPFTGELLEPLEFTDIAFGDSVGFGTQLPNLGLDRVFLLTTGQTCSASEALINGLNGIGVEVIQIGETTCGKPYGFYPQANCGKVYYHINFQGENNLGFGDYDNGFSPTGTDPNSAGVTNPGCAVGDDWFSPLGSESEALLAAALTYRATDACPTGLTAQSANSSAPKAYRQPLGQLPASLWRPNAR